MTTRTFYILKQEGRPTDMPWWVGSTVFDDERGTVRHKIAFGPFATEAEAKKIMEQAGG